MSGNLYDLNTPETPKTQLYVTDQGALVRIVGDAGDGKALVLPYDARREEPVPYDRKKLTPASG